MTEIVAALLLITFCLFIWKMVKSIEINVTVKVPAIKVGVEMPITVPPIKAEILPQPIVVGPGIEDDIYDDKGNMKIEKSKVNDPMALFNTVMHGIEEVMNDES